MTMQFGGWRSRVDKLNSRTVVAPDEEEQEESCSSGGERIRIDGLVSRTFDYCFGTSVAGIDGCWDRSSIDRRNSKKKKQEESSGFKSEFVYFSLLVWYGSPVVQNHSRLSATSPSYYHHVEEFSFIKHSTAAIQLASNPLDMTSLLQG
eukprot:scaffold1415_cov237-Chaetoceros_neogracile.AAC.1